MDNLLYLSILLALGMMSRRVAVFPENTALVLNRFVIYLSFPATVLLKTNGMDLEADFIALALTPWVLILLSVIAVRLIAGIFEWDRKVTGAVLLSVGLGNTTFFGFPAITAFFGADYLSYAIIYDQFGTFLGLAIFGTLVVSIYGNAGKVSFRSVLKSIFGFPPFAALIIGFAAMHTTYPQILVKVLDGLSATLIPLIIFSVGAQLRLKQPSSNILPIALTLFLKMVVAPLLTLPVLLFLGIRGPVLDICVFSSAMPSMVMAGILAQTGNLNADVANAAVGYGILLAFITLPLLHALLTVFA